MGEHVTHSNAAGSGAGGRAPRRYLTGLDGLRAIAVVSVMLFHFDAGLDGGFLGVDVFFVLSGYLITSQLLVRWTSSSVDLKHFWGRRIRRLFPAVAFLLMVVSVVMLLLDRSAVRSYVGDVLAAGTYTSNWWYILQERSYFEAAGRPPVLQHLWSLAVEEQFYLVWPLVVAALTFAFLTRNSRRWAVFTIAVLGAVASSIWMGTGTAAADLPASGDTSRFYFGTDSHAMGLLTGAALAALRGGAGFTQEVPPLKRAGFLWTVLGLAGLAGLGWFFVTQPETSEWLYRYGFAVLAVLVAGLIIAATRPGPVEWLLSLPVLRYLGTRSYSLYLWHWPIAAFTRPGADVEWPEPVVTIVRWGLTLLAAEVSYRLVENPVRIHGLRDTWARMRRAGRAPLTAAAGLTTAVVAVAVALGAVAVTTDPQKVEDEQVEEVLGDSDIGVEDGAQPTPSDGGPQEPGDGGVPKGDVPSKGAESPTTSPKTPPATTGGKGADCDPTKITGDRVSEGAEEKWLGQSQLAVDTLPVPSDGTRLGDGTQCMDVTVLGDSVPMSAGPVISRAFGALDLRATVGVQATDVLEFVKSGVDAGDVKSDVVVIHTGNNGVIRKDALLEAADSLAKIEGVKHIVLVRPNANTDWDEENQKVFDEIESEKLPDKVSVADWRSVSEGHDDWFLEDGTHPDYIGKVHYVEEIQRAISEG
ncbi:acyltransferase family protein [Kytococcus sp. Marseille-QA3725]